MKSSMELGRRRCIALGKNCKRDQQTTFCHAWLAKLAAFAAEIRWLDQETQMHFP